MFDFLSNIHPSDIWSAITRLVIGWIAVAIGFVVKLELGIRKSVKKQEEENKALKAELIKIITENVELSEDKHQYRLDIDRMWQTNSELSRRLEAFEARIVELETENAELKVRVAELEAINQVEPVRKRGTDELRTV